MPVPHISQDWVVIEESPSGLGLTFVNRITGEETLYTPVGMTAAEILAIPDAKKYWHNMQAVEKYIREKDEEKIRSGGKNYDTQK